MESNESLPETLAAQINALLPRKRAARLAFVTHMDLVDRLIDVSFAPERSGKRPWPMPGPAATMF
ncbi:MAG: hypothetical protein MR419_01420 [Clostridiales bacterium]|nr:hypothetical protein [Clostridiales bacterium]MDY4173156.1 hypothetical protein [Evtepia sp.]